VSKPKHRLSKGTRPRRIQYKSTPHRVSLRQQQRRGVACQFGVFAGVAAGLTLVGMVSGVALVTAGFPPDLSSPPSPSTGQRPLGPSWLPGGGVGLHASGLSLNPLFRSPTLLDASVSGSPGVLRDALTLPLSLTVPAPSGSWVAGHWIPSDNVVRPPCPSPVLDPVGFRLWFARFFPGRPVPTPPAAPPVVTSPPVTAPVTTPPPVVASAPVQEPSSPPPASPPPSPAQSLPVEVGPVAQPVSVDPPALDVPPVVVDVPSLPPVEIDPPPIDLPPVSVPPVDLSPVTDPVTAVVDQAGADVTQLPDVLNAPVADVAKQLTDATAAGVPVQLSAAPEISAPTPQLNDAHKSPAAATHSTSGNVISRVVGHLNGGDVQLSHLSGGSYVGQHRAGSVQPGGNGHGRHGVGDHTQGRHAGVSGGHDGASHHDSGGRHRAVDHGGSHGHGGGPHGGGNHGSHGGGGRHGR
jgi:hypothetical protein